MAQRTPHHLRARAAVLRRVATAIDGCGARSLRWRAGTDVWIGPTATACLEDVTLHGILLTREVEDLRAAARALEAEAAALELAARVAPDLTQP